MRCCPAAHRKGATQCDSTKEGTDVEDDEQEELERVREWIGRLEAFLSSITRPDPAKYPPRAGRCCRSTAVGVVGRDNSSHDNCRDGLGGYARRRRSVHTR